MEACFSCNADLKPLVDIDVWHKPNSKKRQGNGIRSPPFVYHLVSCSRSRVWSGMSGPSFYFMGFIFIIFTEGVV